MFREQVARARGEKKKKRAGLTHLREDKAESGRVSFDLERETLRAFLTRDAPLWMAVQMEWLAVPNLTSPGPTWCRSALPTCRAGYLPLVTELSAQPALRSPCQCEMARALLPGERSPDVA